MCDYSFYEAISRKSVVIRKARDCDSCDQQFPAGTRMTMHVGKQEGEMCRTYGCAACEFASKQEDETALHLCWNWGYDRSYGYEVDYIGDPMETWNYINATLAKGETPTVEGVKAHHAALQEAEEE